MNLSLFILSMIVMGCNIVSIVFLTPMVPDQEWAQKIFYLHVPLAWSGFLSYFFVMLSGLLYLYSRNLKYDRIGHAAAEIGTIFTGLVLVTGPIWATPIWGKPWIWEPRLITTLVLFIIYAGLIALGALYNAEFPVDISRTNLLSGLASKTLGNLGAVFLSVLVGLACFTTAVGIIMSTADFFKALFKDSKKAYVITTMVCCIAGILVGQFEVSYIIKVALPSLMFIYPLCIVLILLNAIQETYASKLVFRWVVFVTFMFSIPDFLNFVMPVEKLEPIIKVIPLAQQNLGWVLPALTTFILVNIYQKLTNRKEYKPNF